MSHYIALTRIKETGEVVLAEWLDDYFGRHRYAVRLPDGRVFRAEKCEIVQDNENETYLGDRLNINEGEGHE